MTPRPAHATGFTLIELLISLAVVASIGVLLAGAGAGPVPQGQFYDTVLTALHQARNTAVASRCPVRVQLGNAQVYLLQQPLCGSAGYSSSDAYSQALSAAGDFTANPYSADPGATLITFDALGQALDSSGALTNQTFSLEGRNLILDAATGVAHAP